MKNFYANHPDDVKQYSTEELRKKFLKERIFITDEIELAYSHNDRIIFGGAYPVNEALKLVANDELRAEYFLERREMGAINVGGDGLIVVDGEEFEINHFDGIYIGKGKKEVFFQSKDSKNPAKFYINSCPAHKVYPTKKIGYEDANHLKLGTEEEINKRQLNQYIHPSILETCQLSMGLTALNKGSAWNTMPTHTHERRMEVYFYFDMEEETRVFHMMGKPCETRHIVICNEQAVISPSWSIHSGVGTKNYAFIWGMCGENQDFNDMDSVKMSELK